MVVWVTHMRHFFWIPFDQSSCFAWLWVHIWFFSGSSPVHVLLLVRWILAVRPMGRLTSPTMGVALLLFYAFIVGKVSLTWKMRNMWSLCLLSRQGSTLPHSCYYLHLWVSVHKAQSPAARPGVHLSLASWAPVTVAQLLVSGWPVMLWDGKTQGGVFVQVELLK